MVASFTNSFNSSVFVKQSKPTIATLKVGDAWTPKKRKSRKITKLKMDCGSYNLTLRNGMFFRPSSFHAIDLKKKPKKGNITGI